MVAAEIKASMEVTNELMDQQEKKQSRKSSARMKTTKQQIGETTVAVLDGGKGDNDDEQVAEDQAESRKRTKVPQRSQRLREDPWVPARFRIRESKEYALHQIYYQQKLKGNTDVTQQALVDEALEWLMKKYG